MNAQTSAMIPPPAIDVTDIKSKAMLAGLSISCWGAKKNLRQVAQEAADSHGANVKQIKANKSLIAHDALERIKTIETLARTYHRDHTLPWLDDGARILPAASFWTYSQTMTKFRQDHELEVSGFLQDYPTLVAEAETLLGGLYNAADYPPVGKIADKFGFRVSIAPLPSGEDFRVGLGATEEARLKAEIDARLQDGVNQAMKDLWTQTHNMVAHMAQKLRAFDVSEEVDPATGKVKTKTTGIFRDSLVENLRDLVGMLPAMNITGDARLAQMSQEIEEKLCDLDADDLRNNDSLRDQVATSAEDILAQMAGYIG